VDIFVVFSVFLSSLFLLVFRGRKRVHEGNGKSELGESVCGGENYKEGEGVIEIGGKR